MAAAQSVSGQLNDTGTFLVHVIATDDVVPYQWPAHFCVVMQLTRLVDTGAAFRLRLMFPGEIALAPIMSK